MSWIGRIRLLYVYYIDISQTNPHQLRMKSTCWRIIDHLKDLVGLQSIGGKVLYIVHDVLAGLGFAGRLLQILKSLGNQNPG